MSDTWYYADQNKQLGPVGIQQLKAALLNIPNARNVLVWHPGFTDWKKAGDVPELSAETAAPLSPFAERTVAPAGMSAGNQTDIPHLWFSFSGRLNRGKYWLVSLCNLAILMIAVIAGFAINSVLVWVFLGLVILAVMVSGYAVAAKRLHDRDKSGWWILIYYFVPSIISGAGGQTGDQGMTVVTGLISIVIYLVAFIDLGCLRGTVGDNRFGPDPLSGQS